MFSYAHSNAIDSLCKDPLLMYLHNEGYRISLVIFLHVRVIVNCITTAIAYSTYQQTCFVTYKRKNSKSF